MKKKVLLEKIKQSNYNEFTAFTAANKAANLQIKLSIDEASQLLDELVDSGELESRVADIAGVKLVMYKVIKNQ